ncbi:Pimeloyl-ACP methyl ester carboxylesterase [Saccharopolyspora kobensis]|uniref:Pimeloyl-ACP methyl ester carboxylesterase n=1 Tax=Saccharopolyspora kobensis TaxID=146035 RepID=A0A1H5TV53_9PSEU|nr:alpha/beta hydrolase [Saccharopolyspora kobensis]SEF66673.1 Pimeloyl-ACP methyl ester carboxylesterase [Saccharopolyspora kobensis]SFC42030.1 Pimeloyl-ACP methyl ester carboxylesterase [Saccharopolyspora kobensis]
MTTAWLDTDLARWVETCRDDRELSGLAAAATVTFGIRADDRTALFGFHGGELAEPADDPDFVLVAADADWSEFFQPVPPPAHQNFFGMLMRVPGARVEGSELAMAQHAHIVRRVLELGREAISGPLTAPAAHPARGKAHLRPGYVRISVRGEPVEIFYEEAGAGPDVLLLHTAGADARQYHELMADPALASRCRLVAFDLPGHGRSGLLPGVVPGGYSLTTDQYATAVLAVIDALGLVSPVVSGSSMGGEICLELAHRAPHALGGVIACEASDRVPGRKVPWAKHPAVNESTFVPEWVYGLMAPQSPERCRREVWWGYSQGGFGTFAGDIDFYSGDWDGRERVGEIDTSRCPVIMMTGEYDYSCTPAMSAATARKIPGAVFWPMPDLGHFPMAENPPLFAEHFAAALDRLGIP